MTGPVYDYIVAWVIGPTDGIVAMKHRRVGLKMLILEACRKVDYSGKEDYYDKVPWEHSHPAGSTPPNLIAPTGAVHTDPAGDLDWTKPLLE